MLISWLTYVTTEISKVHLRHELLIDTGDWWTVFTEKFHQKETKVDVQNELRTKKLYSKKFKR